MNPSPELFAKLLPKDVYIGYGEDNEPLLKWREPDEKMGMPVLETEYLHLCHLAEERLAGEIAKREYVYGLADLMTFGKFTVLADWPERLTALCEVNQIK